MNLIDKVNEQIYDMGTDRQKQVVDAVRSAGSTKEAAKQLGLPASTVTAYISRLLKKAAKAGIAPYANMITPAAEGFTTKRVSTYQDETGRTLRQWHIQEPSKVKQLELMEELSQSLLVDIPPREPTLFNLPVDKDLMVNIPIGDAHIGMLAWEEECGEGYDLNIAENLHKNAVDLLIDRAPNAEQCTILDLGDFLHSDNMEGMTSRSGHSLDMAGRYHQIIRVAIRIVMYYIERALTKFEYVTYRPEMGNHNDLGAVWMQELLATLYRDEPRVTIANGAGGVFYWQHGNCYFMSHHGHQIKGNRLTELFAKQMLDNQINAKHRKIYLGHVHHKSVTENAVCEIQTYRTLAAKDAYAAGHGYHAGRSITAEVWHKKFGEISSVNVTVPMLEDM